MQTTFNVPISLQDLNSLRMVVDMASSHVLDIESGLVEGLYDESENFDLPVKQAAVARIEDLLGRLESTLMEVSHGN